MGGTFDRLHSGHISNLKTAFETSGNVTIGLTTEALHTNKILRRIIRPFDERKKHLSEVVAGKWPDALVRIVAISDMYGPSVTDREFDSIIVTKETFRNGLKINEIRAKNGLPKLEIVTAPWLVADDGGMLSSSRIRLGEINRKGFVYRTMFEKTLLLPDSLRDEFKKPTGRVVRGAEDDLTRAAHKAQQIIETMKPTLVIAVGDMVTASLTDVGFTPHVSIIDYKTQRKNLLPIGSSVTYDGINDPGTINRAIVPLIARAIARALNNPTTDRSQIVVDGEEDLLVPPSILLAPLRSVVLHGQVGDGIVITQVDEQMKNFICNLLGGFKTKQ